MSDTPRTLQLALLSHTNVGKTTLARTLLRQDIGDVNDRPHVTELAEPHRLMESAQGDTLMLWDTPGFGDSVKLLRRLRQSGQPIGWMLSQVWDRFAHRAFWCSQQALRAARDSADVVLYVVNATEDPESAGYVGPELEILGWLGKPALVLVNQLGPAGSQEAEAATLRRWQARLDEIAPGVPMRLLPFDAFARCWLQEHALLEAIAGCLQGEDAPAFERLREAWRKRDLGVLGASAAAVARQLESCARDVEQVANPSLLDRARQMMTLGSREATPGEVKTQEILVERLNAEVRRCTAELVRLHGLVGGADKTILKELDAAFRTDRPADADRAGVLGGLVSGALAGLAADLATGGLSFGAGALIGAIAGAVGARKVVQVFNAERGLDASTVRWSDAFLEARLAASVVQYLAVAHFGRGRGEFIAGEPPAGWAAAVAGVLASDRERRVALWASVRASTGPHVPLEQAVHDALRRTLVSLYPIQAATAQLDRDRAIAAR